MSDASLILGLIRCPAAQLPAGAVALAAYGPQLERSIVDMVQEQSRRLQAMSDDGNRGKACIQGGLMSDGIDA